MTREELNARTPVPPIDMTNNLACPLLGIFGNDDTSPTPEAVDTLEAALRAAGKQHEFHRYDGAGHGFMHSDGLNYRPAQALDAWTHVWDFFERHLA